MPNSILSIEKWVFKEGFLKKVTHRLNFEGGKLARLGNVGREGTFQAARTANA